MIRARVKGHTNLAKDLHSGAVINTNHTEYEAFRRRVEAERAKEERLDAMEARMSRIEALLEKLVNG